MFKYTQAFARAKKVFERVHALLASEHKTPLFNAIRNLFIESWGQDLVPISADCFGLTRSACYRILKKEDVEKKFTETIVPRAPTMRIRERPEDWVRVLQRVLTKKSGEMSAKSVRSPYSKSVLYDLFKTGYYTEALDYQLTAETTLIEEAERVDAKGVKPTRFIRNIRLLLKWRKENKRTIISMTL